MKFEHLYQGRGGYTRPEQSYHFGIYLTFEQDVTADSPEAAREIFDEAIQEMRRCCPELEPVEPI